MKLLNLILIILVSIAYAYAHAGTVYKVSKNIVNIRKDAKPSSSVVGTLKVGQLIYATSITKGWAKFYKGYVEISSLTEVKVSTAYTTKEDKVCCRDGPFSNYGCISTKKKGTPVTYYGVDPFNKDWCITNYGYIHSKSISVKPNTSAPVPPAKVSSYDKPAKTSPVKISQMLCNRKNYGGKRSTSSIKYIVIHYTSDYKNSAEVNAKFFQKTQLSYSYHYVIDGSQVIRTVPDDYVAWSIDSNKMKGKLAKKVNNDNALHIELCNSQNNEKETSKTMEMAAKIISQKMAEYNISKANVIRINDVSGKDCPVHWLNDSKQWNGFQKKF